MDAVFSASLILLPVFYTVLVIGYARLFLRPPEGVARITRPVLLATISLHVFSVLIRGWQIGACPLATRWEKLSLIALSITVTYLIVELGMRRRSTGVFALVIPFLLQVVSSIFMLAGPPPTADPLGMVPSLCLLAEIVGFSAVVVSTLYGLLYLSLYGAIKSGSFGTFFRRMPDLETLSRQNFRAALIAAFAFTIVFGAMTTPAARGMGGVSGIGIEREMAFLAWAIFTGAVVARRLHWLGAKRLAYLTVVGFVPAAALLVLGIIRGGNLG